MVCLHTPFQWEYELVLLLFWCRKTILLPTLWGTREIGDVETGTLYGGCGREIGVADPGARACALCCR